MNHVRSKRSPLTFGIFFIDSFTEPYLDDRLPRDPSDLGIMMGAVAPRCGGPLRKTNGRAAAPSGAYGSGANAPFRLMPRRLRRASRTAAARHPYLGRKTGAVAPWCGGPLRKTNGRAAAPSGAYDSGANAPFRLMPRRLRRASRTAAARHPYLGRKTGAVAPRCGSNPSKTAAALWAY